ncbi:MULTISPECIES: G-D-S-L family lipolytic protein [Aequorivita]|uniref:G-D-S-L family lipolytic protein n=1 Tax=Aequorivita iocasae TaxID=2803865 RepID=A0ABX7DW55_9FLAO|nr:MULTISPECIES: G-D-S-L family lipolytic protein [Aequorivita]QQX77947.1 G-D-S-L family lipolytic protein [Aequorivita iocasae]UCA57449.1 G-D-S-L family lipolytic protein [Aequorivita sp. F7]
MKNILKYTFAVLAVGFVSCEPEFDSPVTDDGFYSSGSADFSKYVSVGNSLTAGYADGALYITGQNNSYPNIMAQQFSFVGGGDFTQPLMNDNLGGLLLGGSQIAENRFVLAVGPNGNPGPVRLDGMPTTDVSNKLSGSFNNMGVPGAKSFHLVAPGYGNVAGVPTGAANPYFARFASSESATVIGDAAAQNATFFTLWIGNNDILSYATSGGAGVDQTGNLDPTSYGSNDITDPNVFAAVYSQQVDALTANGAKGVLVNIPEVTSIPYFTTVPTNAIPLDAATAAQLNAQFAAYNNQILPGLVGIGLISAEEAALRMINFSASLNNFPIMTDDDLTDITTVLQGPPFNLPAQLAALLGQLRQVNANDLIVLPASSVLGSTPDPNNPQGVIGVSIPLTDQYVLAASEQARVTAASTAYNATIQALAGAKNLAFVDAKAALSRVANGGIVYDGGLLTSQFVTGGAFSLDGVHPTPRGYAYTANLIIQAINDTYDATIPKVHIGNYGTVTVTNN